MDSDQVTKSESGDGGSDQTAPARYGEIFEKMCPYYMSIGMTYDEYWNGEAVLCKYYRESHEKVLREENAMMHRQGAYIYQALLCASPLYNALSKKREAYPYPEDVIPLNERQSKEIKEEKERRKMEENKVRMKMLVDQLNKKFLDKKEQGNAGC